MPDLLEEIADNDTSVLKEWTAGFNDRAPRINALPDEQRGRELLTLAREFTRRAAWATDTAEGWLTELKTRLQRGMGGHKLRDLLRSGRALCGVCRSVVEIAGDLWRLTDVPGGEALSALGQRLAAVEAEITTFTKRVAPPTPEMIEKLFERAEGQMRSGKGLTREQAPGVVRKSG